MPITAMVYQFLTSEIIHPKIFFIDPSNNVLVHLAIIKVNSL